MPITAPDGEPGHPMPSHAFTPAPDDILILVGVDPRCPDCGGDGFVDVSDYNNFHLVDCPACGGTGERPLVFRPDGTPVDPECD